MEIGASALLVMDYVQVLSQTLKILDQEMECQRHCADCQKYLLRLPSSLGAQLQWDTLMLFFFPQASSALDCKDSLLGGDQGSL